jgi:hypothetical protein
MMDGASSVLDAHCQLAWRQLSPSVRAMLACYRYTCTNIHYLKNDLKYKHSRCSRVQRGHVNVYVQYHIWYVPWYQWYGNTLAIAIVL